MGTGLYGVPVAEINKNKANFISVPLTALKNLYAIFVTIR